MIAGIARQLDADATSMELESCVGTLNYMSPEVLQGIGCKDLNSKVSYSVTALRSTSLHTKYKSLSSRSHET